jgi:predicted transcriptional regulator
MPWIRPEHKITRDTLSLKMDIVVMRQLEQYATFLQSTQAYVATEILRDVFARDKDFQAWLRAQPASTDESADRTTDHTTDRSTDRTPHAAPAPALREGPLARRRATRIDASSVAVAPPIDEEAQ